MGISLGLVLGETLTRRVVEGSWSAAISSFASGYVPLSDVGSEVWAEAHPELGYRQRANTELTNSIGLRNPEISVAKPAGRRRLLVLGDSVSADRDGYVATLRQQLMPEIEVINAAVPGYTTYQERVFLERDLLRLEPDFVLLQYCLNDNHRFLHKVDPTGRFLFTEEAERIVQPDSGWLALLPRNSYLAHRIRLALLARPAVESNFDWRTAADVAPAWQQSSWIDFRHELGRIQALASAADAKLAVIAPPYIPQLDPRVEGEQMLAECWFPQAQLRAICDVLRIPLSDLAEPIATNGSWALYRDRIHFNDAGNQVVAEATLTFLRDLDWVQ